EPAGSAGWTGADSTYSVKLPNGDSAFFFSDSYIAESPELSGDGTVATNANGLRTRIANCGPPICDPPTALFRSHNSIVIRDHVTGELRTKTGAKDVTGYSLSYFAPLLGTVNNSFFWMGDSIVVQVDAAGTKKLWVYLLEFDNTFKFFGSSVAQLSLPDLQIESVKSITPLTGTASPIYWGAGLWLEGEFGNRSLYIYGMDSTSKPGRKLPVVARVNPDLGFDAAADSTNWTVWNGSTWVSGLSNARLIIGAPGDLRNATNSISDEFSVTKVNVGGASSYLLVGMDTTASFGSWKDVTIYSACNPQGPFSAKKVVYSTPETNSKKVPGMTADQNLFGVMFVYNPHFHPEFSDTNNMLISYNSNAGQSRDLLFADTYRPRFFRTQISQALTTAATVAVSGKVTAGKRGVAMARVTLTSESGKFTTVKTNSFGFYRFSEVAVGETYSLQVAAKNYSFASQVLSVNEEVANVDFKAER
ncbi:MAG: carboxypeptidase regulatory-like domain-containing protein, partial [Pyrinomonadaceae bacterium]|nr:carboxypeptidase regulatory-like domain-containing protein [Pyrinomonadaceae bacterium]